MTSPNTTPLNATQREALEARFALRLSARLEEGAQSLPHDISERLRVAREQAVGAAREARRVKVVAPELVSAPILAGVSIAGVGVLGGWSESAQSRQHGHGRLDNAPTSWVWRFASALPILALVAGLWGVQRYYRHEQVQAATEVDMALLTDALPPSAYADPGFTEYLRSTPSAPADVAPAAVTDLTPIADATTAPDITTQ